MENVNDAETGVESPAAEPMDVDPPVENEENEDEEGGGEAADEGDPMDASADGPNVSTEQYKVLRNICEIISTHKVKSRNNEDYYPSLLFRRIPNKRNMPEYYEVIKEPVAISTLKHKIQTKKYESIAEFVKDFAMIVHNAQVYNRPNSQPVRDILVLKQVFDEELQKIVQEGLISEEDTSYPDLGPIPDATPEPDPVSEEEEEEVDEEGDEDDEDDEGDDSDDDRRKKKGRKRGSLAGRKHGRDDEEDTSKAAEDLRKRRGRPPRVDTPMEARIKAILKGIRKPKDEAGNSKIRHFDRLPDKGMMPEYYQIIKDPIALDILKRKSKRKKYRSLDEFMKDIDLMFDNAMAFNEDDSDIFQDAKDLKEEAKKLLAAEKAKPDEEYMMEDGRLPLPNGILHRNELWRIGDWILLQNLNDVTKPIVAQIYRTWQDPEGQKWINACWYYRPEQTVHQYEKHFFPNEVVKTGQYRDHQIDEIVDRCFVMFFTRYSRGRPRDLGDKEVFVCEARYNEEKHRLNKIKTWASCLPDEVRDKDYDMDLFDAPRRIKKVPSPLLYLLDNEKEGIDLSQPEWGLPNAPPRRGGIHKGSRDENQSPPPEPTPPPPPTPPPQPVRPVVQMPNAPITISMNSQNTRTPVGQAPSINRAIPYQPPHMANTPSFNRHTSYTAAGGNQSYLNSANQIPPKPATTPYSAAQHQLHGPPALAAAHPTNYNANVPTPSYSRPPMTTPQAQQYPYAATSAQTSRGQDVFVLKDTANEAIAREVRDQFPQDDTGRVLFFTTPPQDTRRFVEGRTAADKGRPLAHSEAYLTHKAEKVTHSASHRRMDGDTERPLPAGSFVGERRDADGRISSDPAKAAQITAELEQKATALRKAQKERAAKLLNKGLGKWITDMNTGTEKIYETTYGPDWRQVLIDAQDDSKLDPEHLARIKKREEKEKKMERFRKQSTVEPEYMVEIYKDHATGVFLDDYDPRYGF